MRNGVTANEMSQVLLYQMRNLEVAANLGHDGITALLNSAKAFRANIDPVRGKKAWRYLEMTPIDRANLAIEIACNIKYQLEKEGHQ